MRYFVAVADELSYRKASQRLHIAQPALSRQVRDLESELGVQLLSRNQGGVRLTEAGATFLTEARHILSQSQRAMALTRDAANGLRGRLAVGYVEPLLMGFMPATLTAFHRKFPNVEVTLVEMSLVSQIEAVESGNLQVGFTVAGAAYLPSGMGHVEIAHSPIRAAMLRSHPLARPARVALADLAQAPILCLSLKKEAASLHVAITRRIFKNRSLKMHLRQIEGTEAFRAAIESGLGVSLVPTVGGISQNRTLVMKPLKDSGTDLFVDLEAVWCDLPTSLVALNFISTIREIVRQKNICARKPAASGI
ncbi:MAG: LysR family transcriptional regulator [Verrucomicrobia bacterium]|nr:LysR family transcriptional regulator [Verrucomicrobiota bacterium]